MQVVNINARSLGVNFNIAGQADIAVWSPIAKSIDLFLEETGETIPLVSGESGFWNLQTPKLKPNGLYKFIIDGDQKYPDPAS